MKKLVRNKVSFTDEVTELEKTNLQVAYDAAAESIVLLLNDGCLPVKPGKIALYGAGAEMTIKGGIGSGEVNERHAVSIMEGLEMAGFTVTSKGWLKTYRELYESGEVAYGKEFRRKVLSFDVTTLVNIMSSSYQHPFGQPITEKDVAESNTDICIYVVARQAGEGSDKKLEKNEYALTEAEKANICFCAEHYEKMILVINVGSSFDMSFLEEISGISAVLFFCQQGTMGGKAFADIVSGAVTPSGKLTDTWAKKYDDIPFAREYSYLNGNLAEEYYKEGIYVGYRYFDSFNMEPRYPFGYGLSYTEFAICAEDLCVDKTEVTIRVRVKNIGNTYSGREVVQLYVSSPNGKLHKEYQSLAAFAKTNVLLPGEEEILQLSFDLKNHASYREADSALVLEAGNYLLRLGNSSRNTSLCGVVSLDGEAVVSRHLSVCPQKNGVEELKAAPFVWEECGENVPVFGLKAADIETRHYSYEPAERYSNEESDRILNRLNNRELVSLVVGAGNFGKGKYFQAPGCAGKTTSKLLKKGIPNVCLADGPAGLRLQRRLAVKKNGKLKAIDPIMSPMKYLPKFLKRFILADPEKSRVAYQFTTAFPVELALAQTWNVKLLETVGDAVGKEMEKYGVTYWLAPALNIHRNPLCGRNFEYYSEDPLLSGKLAAAVTKGVQSHPGCFVTLKHFCCNNQEDNRNRTNANVNERTLREIYLKGFEIAVRTGSPRAMMTSYNKVNGEYVNNSVDLNTKVLRGEWGFDGVVMTDWLATGNGLGSHARAIASGNDLIMPGGNSAEKEIYKALKKGLVSEGDLKRCAANVLRDIMDSNIYKEYLTEEK